MVSLTTILIPIQITFFVITILLAIIYLIPILLIRRFHNVNNIFTVNLCVASICCDIYWLSNFINSNFFPQNSNDAASCFAQNYFAMVFTMQVPLALIEIAIHRLSSVVYHRKPFFKKKRWVIICILCQWIAGVILSLPEISSINSVRFSDHN